MDPKEIRERAYQAPITDAQKERMDSIREKYADLLEDVADLCPSTRLTSIALTELETSCMYAIKAIANMYAIKAIAKPDQK